MKNIDIYNFLDKLFPVASAYSFDNSGFLIGDKNAEATDVLVTLDCDKTAVNKALELGCQLIVTHHPIIFDALKSVTEENLVYLLLKNGISVISMHTNLDMGIGGVNDTLCRALGLEGITVYEASDGFLLRKGTTNEISPRDFAKKIKSALGGVVKFVDGGKPIRSVLVCSGSGGEFLSEVHPACCDALVSADIKHHIFVEAQNQGISVFDAGHFNTEDIITEPLAELIKESFPELKIFVHHSDFIDFV